MEVYRAAVLISTCGDHETFIVRLRHPEVRLVARIACVLAIFSVLFGRSTVALPWALVKVSREG